MVEHDGAPSAPDQVSPDEGREGVNGTALLDVAHRQLQLTRRQRRRHRRIVRRLELAARARHRRRLGRDGEGEQILDVRFCFS